ncbi:TIR domain-containing protein [Dyella sp. Tek66A03]|uniref:TIR domain-containing protein n=1 Tax=Dyella sp. Tek66A03 TaxID=3458298 RepID=UPI00403EE2FE
MTQASAEPVFRYRAFISYSHQDKTWADWLHKALETYAIPKRLVGQTTSAGVTPKRLAPIFRDRDELASATDLGRKVNEALGQSANLVVICSPRSATSHWVNEEVLAYKRLGRSERIFCLIVDGEPNASALPGHEAEECFAPALRYQLGADGELTEQPTEPIAADARPGKDGKTNAKLKLVAGILDVDFDALKRRELQRRTRRMTALATLALIVFAVTTTLAITAVIARNAAVRRQKQAEDLISFMLGDLNDKLAQVSRLDIMEAVDDHAMSYFQSLPTTDVTSEALAQRAKALEKIGSVRLDQGHLPAAMVAYQAASNIAAKLADASPEDTTRQLSNAEIWAFIGMAHWRQGQLDAAQQAFASAQSILQHARSRAPNDTQLRFQLETIDNNVGHVLEAHGRLDEATTQYREMLAIMQRLVVEQPNDTEWAAELGKAHNNLGRMALLSGDLATAVTQYADDDAIESALATRDPKDNNQRDNMLTVRAILGRTVAMTGDIKTGMDDLQQAVDIATALKAIDPNNTDFQVHVALYATQLGRLRRLNGELPAAGTLTEEALVIFIALTKQDPDNASWRREFAEAQLEQAEHSLAAGQADKALSQAESSLLTLRPLLAKQPDDRATLLATVGAKLLLAQVSANAEVSQRLLDEALRETQSAKKGNADPRLLALRVEVLLTLGRKAEAQPAIQQLWSSGYRDAALVGVLQREQVDYPINTAFQQKLLAASSAGTRR